MESKRKAKFISEMQKWIRGRKCRPDWPSGGQSMQLSIYALAKGGVSHIICVFSSF
jgi:hypothetical protein